MKKIFTILFLCLSIGVFAQFERLSFDTLSDRTLLAIDQDSVFQYNDTFAFPLSALRSYSDDCVGLVKTDGAKAQIVLKCDEFRKATEVDRQKLLKNPNQYALSPDGKVFWWVRIP